MAAKRLYAPCNVAPTGLYVDRTVSRLAIIGLLSTLAIVALGTARAKSRDARRVADLKSIQTAFEMYNNEKGGYPVTSSILLGDTTHACLDSGGFHSPGACAGAYINFPKDPAGGYYTYTGIANNYQVSAGLEGNINDLTGTVTVSPNSGVIANSLALSIPFNSPGCYPSGSALGTLGETVSTTRSTSATYVDANGILQSCDANQLRVTPSGALIEPAATNRALYSEDGMGWVGGGTTTPTVVNGVTYLGLTCASATFVPGMNTGYFGARATRATNQISITNGQTDTLSEYVSLSRPLTGSESLVVYWTGILASPYFIFNSSNSADFVNVFKRISHTATWGGLTGTDYPTVFLNNSYLSSDITVYVTRLQAESGSIVTSYIPTNGSVVTRSADWVSTEMPAGLSPTQWCIAVTANPPSWTPGSGIYQTVAAAGSWNTANTWGLYSTAINERWVVWDSSGADQGGVLTLSAGQHRLGGCLSGQQVLAYSDGTANGTPDTASFSSLPTTIYLGSNSAGSNLLSGTISNFLVCKTGTYGLGGCR